VQSFLKEGLIDKLILTQVPMLLGEGISLFNDNLGRRVKLEHLETKAYSNGLVQSSYRVNGGKA
jgi:dihydrofolate reductase